MSRPVKPSTTDNCAAAYTGATAFRQSGAMPWANFVKNRNFLQYQAVTVP
jgi:hypothetical protein